MITSQSSASGPPFGRWPHRLAWLLACATLPLVTLGGAVTTYEAGMAVEDWPTTFGYWFYPVKLWLAFWDLFLEHGHRMLAQVVGVITIALAVALWRCDSRRWVKWLGAAAVAGVIVQGVLGGFRVILDARVLAMIHGCTAPLLFGLAAALITLTSPRWIDRESARGGQGSPLLARFALCLTLALYAEIVLGAQLRHQTPSQCTGWFTLWVWLKLIGAAGILMAIAWLLAHAGRRVPYDARISRWSWTLAGLYLAQLALGAGTWLTNYGWPAWLARFVWPAPYTVLAEGPLQAITTTAHAAAGSLVLAASLCLMLWSRRAGTLALS